jgi:Uma2 family endonuclease
MHMAANIKRWSLDELHRLPDDGNKYEVVRGDLFVTPPPSVKHEEIASVLAEILHRYVAAQRLGRVYGPRAVIRALESEADPDLMVRPVSPGTEAWDRAPLPILVVEIVSGSTRRRDHIQKRQFYLELGIPEYWIVDGQTRSVRIVRPDASDRVERGVVAWQPPGASDALTFDVADLFRAALGE